MATPGRGGPHTCSSAVSGGPSIALADLLAASAPPVLTLCVHCAMHCAMLHHQHALLWQIRGRRSSGYGQHIWPRGNRQEMHGHLAGSNSWPHRSAMWQEERTTTWCVCACDNKISRVFSAVRSLGHCLSLSAVRLAIACFFIFLQSVWPQPTSSSRFCCDIALQPSPLTHYYTPVRPRVEA